MDTQPRGGVSAGLAVLIEGRRLPEEIPDTPWDVSQGVRFAYSAVIAEQEEQLVEEQLRNDDAAQGLEVPLDVDDEAPRSDDAGGHSYRATLILKAAAGKADIDSLTSREQMQALCDGFAAEDFVERLHRLRDIGAG